MQRRLSDDGVRFQNPAMPNADPTIGHRGIIGVGLHWGWIGGKHRPAAATPSTARSGFGVRFESLSRSAEHAMRSHPLMVPGQSLDAAMPAASRAHFTHYLENRSLPVANAEVRSAAIDGASMTLVSHLSNDGIWFDAIDDLIVSIVVRSAHSNVSRDIGSGLANFREMPGCVLVTPPQTASYWKFNGAPLVLHVSVPQGQFENLLGQSGDDLKSGFAAAASDPIYDRLIAQLTSRMWTELARAQPRSDRFATHALGTMLSLLLNGRDGAAKGEDGGSRNVKPMAAWRLRKVLQHMIVRIGETVTVEELAHVADLSPSHLLRSFASAMNQTPHQWQTNIRIEEAKRLLGESNASLTEIALGLGFSSSAHFSTRFKQVTDMAPSAWRATFGCSH